MASTCSQCGASSDDDHEGEGLPPGWSLGGSDRGVQRLCDTCTRRHVRSIEAKLDEEWWD